MKKRLLALLLAAVMLMGTACTQGGDNAETTAPDTTAPDTTANTTSADTEATTEAVTDGEDIGSNNGYLRPEYTDLTADGYKIEKNNANYAVATSKGTQASGSLVLDFAEQSGFSLSGCTNAHDPLTCSTCGVVEKNGERAFYICQNRRYNSGLTIVLDEPIPASSLNTMSVTYMSDKVLNSSEIRIMPIGTTDTGKYVNTCEKLDKGATEYATADLGMNSFADIADYNGSILGFKLYFRDKDISGLYLKSITFGSTPTESAEMLKTFVSVDAVSGNVFYVGGALQAVADAIADRFTAMDIAAEITVRKDRYTANSPAENGELIYKAIIQIDGKSYTVPSVTTIIPNITNTRLELSDGSYGAQRDSFGQWKDTFDCGGIITLKNNILTAPDKIVSVEYAVIDADADYEDDSTAWYAPQALELSADGFAYLYANAALDYGARLVSGESYRFIIRGVTRNSNYVIHLDIPFEYNPFSTIALNDLDAAVARLEDMTFSLTDDISDRELAIADKAQAALANDYIRVSAKTVSFGVTYSTMDLYVYYVADVPSERMASYSYGDNDRSDFFAFTGEAYKVENVFISCSDKTSSIKLTSPADGQSDVNIASDAIIKHMNTHSTVLGSSSYYFSDEESCSPPPVLLEWSDENAAEGKKYTVVISENADLSSPFGVYETDALSIGVYNLKSGTRYYWQVSGDGVDSIASSFVTCGKYPRFIKVEGLSNMRDIGGYVTVDGKTVKQGLAYRSAYLEPATEADKQMIKDQLGVIVDLDLRGEGATSPLGDWARCLSYGVKHYNWALEKHAYENMRLALSAFAYEENYPMIFHCYIGRDRTGTVTALILGILGVDEETVKQEYMLSLNSVAGHNDSTSNTRLYAYMVEFIDGLAEYGGSNFNESAEAYALTIGVTPEEIASIRRILLED